LTNGLGSWAWARVWYSPYGVVRDVYWLFDILLSILKAIALLKRPFIHTTDTTDVCSVSSTIALRAYRRDWVQTKSFFILVFISFIGSWFLQKKKNLSWYFNNLITKIQNVLLYFFSYKKPCIIPMHIIYFNGMCSYSLIMLLNSHTINCIHCFSIIVYFILNFIIIILVQQNRFHCLHNPWGCDGITIALYKCLIIIIIIIIKNQEPLYL